MVGASVQPHEPSAASSARISRLSGAQGGKGVVSAPRLGWEPIPSREAPGWLQQQRGPGGHSRGVIWVLGEAEAAPAPLRTDLGAGWLLLGGWHLVFGSHPQPGRLLL